MIITTFWITKDLEQSFLSACRDRKVLYEAQHDITTHEGNIGTAYKVTVNNLNELIMLGITTGLKEGIKSYNELKLKL